MLIHKYIKSKDNDFIQNGFAPFKEEYNAHLAGSGKRVVIHDPNGEYEATLIGVNDVGELMVKREEELCLINSGEVSVRGVNGYV